MAGFLWNAAPQDVPHTMKHNFINPHTPTPANPGTLLSSGNLPNSPAQCYSTQAPWEGWESCGRYLSDWRIAFMKQVFPRFRRPVAQRAVVLPWNENSYVKERFIIAPPLPSLQSHQCQISTDLNNNQLHWVQLQSQSNHLSSSNCLEAPSWHENCFLLIPVNRKLYYLFSCANKSGIGQHRVNHRLLLPRICVYIC